MRTHTASGVVEMSSCTRHECYGRRAGAGVEGGTAAGELMGPHPASQPASPAGPAHLLALVLHACRIAAVPSEAGLALKAGALVCEAAAGVDDDGRCTGGWLPWK